MEKQSLSSSPPATVLAIKVHSREARNGFPFDKVYIAKDTALNSLVRAFPFCISMPLEGWHAEKLKNTRVHTVEDKTAPRGGAGSSKDYPGGVGKSCCPSQGGAVMFRASGSPSGLFNELIASDLISASSWEIAPREGGWSLVIPILTRYRKGDLSARPSYLTNPAWRQKIDSGGKGAVRPIRTDSSLHRRGYETLSPPCLACSNMLQRIGGGCELGSTSCFEHMNFGEDSYFRRGLELQKMLPRMSLIEAFRKYTSGGSSNGV